MNSVAKRIELFANVAIIALALLLSGVLAKRYLLPQSPSPQARIEPGTKLSVPGLAWDKNSRTLLLVLSTNCHFCTESAPFYQRLVQEKAKHSYTRLVAVLPQSVGESQKYLTEHGIVVDEVRQAAPSTLLAGGTPTLIMTDRTGSVVASWVGKLPPQQEAEVINSFSEKSGD